MRLILVALATLSMHAQTVVNRGESITVPLALEQSGKKLVSAEWEVGYSPSDFQAITVASVAPGKTLSCPVVSAGRLKCTLGGGSAPLLDSGVAHVRLTAAAGATSQQAKVYIEAPSGKNAAGATVAMKTFGLAIDLKAPGPSPIVTPPTIPVSGTIAPGSFAVTSGTLNLAP
jgi:hypothetical protein